jgi:hypothetical protein
MRARVSSVGTSTPPGGWIRRAPPPPALVPAAGQRIGASEVKREEGALGGTSGGREGVGGVIEGVRLTCGPMSRWLG